MYWTQAEATMRHVEGVFREELAAEGLDGLTTIELHVLFALYEHDGQRASELAHAVGRAATSFTPTLDALEVKGLIKRKADANDRRALQIVLTPLALSLREKALRVKRAAENVLESTIGDVLPLPPALRSRLAVADTVRMQIRPMETVTVS